LSAPDAGRPLSPDQPLPQIHARRPLRQEGRQGRLGVRREGQSPGTGEDPVTTPGASESRSRGAGFRLRSDARLLRLTDYGDRRATHRALALGGGPAVLEHLLLRVVDVAFLPALDTV